jgi:predicted HTH transcriptional regulator
VAAPADPVKAARLEGNSETQSFHESFSTKRTGISHVLRDVVAFANSGGGTIFVGASAAEKRPVHGVEEAETAADSLRAESRPR